MSVKAKTREIAIEPGPTGVFLGYKSAGVSANDKRYRSTIKSYPEGKKDDWSGLYVAEDRLTAEGYLPDALPPDGTGEAYINLIYIETSPVNKFAGKGKKPILLILPVMKSQTLKFRNQKNQNWSGKH